MSSVSPPPGVLRTARVAAFDAIAGLVHGFEQRLGPPGWETREAGRGRVGAALAGRGRLLLMKQVHGRTVRRAPWSGQPEGDASVSLEPGFLLGIETADCLPVLLVDPRHRLAAAAHAGWRGAAAGVVAAAVEALAAAGADRGEILAAVGPGIGACCYEVGDELRAAFGPGGDAFFRPGPRGRPHLDMRAVVARDLRSAGLRQDRVHHVADCTACRADLYHSYRRDGAGAGRMVNFVGWTGIGT
jgi:YfiH family protein